MLLLLSSATRCNRAGAGGKNFNQQTGKENVYDDTPTDEGPDAALDVFQNANK